MQPEVYMVERQTDWTIHYKNGDEPTGYTILLFSHRTPRASVVTITNTCKETVVVKIHSREVGTPGAAPDSETAVYPDGSLVLTLAMVDVFVTPKEKVEKPKDQEDTIMVLSGLLHVAHVLNGP